ncbi:YggT family protein [Celerinatantimonas yamalensis]|uniref:YggT family protein n=1 Tax=Celerinatantimonas yamalensis TaxID=559956 RepID=A0ABW9G8H5_9GAMM
MMAFNYLITTLFDLYLMVIILRVWLQFARADFYNPFSQFVVRATNPLLKPLRRIIPGFAGVDCAGIVLALLVAAAKWAAVMQLAQGAISWSFIPLFALLTVVKQTGSLLFWILLVRAVLSWISQGRSPIEYVFMQLTEPFLAPIRRIIPAMGGLDLSVLVLFIILNFVNMLLTTQIPYWRLM